MNLRAKFVFSIVSLGLLCLTLPGSICADTVDINSINANNSPFFVDISTTSLLAQYGITLANVTPGTTVAVLCGECGGNSIVPSSPPNTLTQFGNDNGMSYTLQFSTPLSTLSFNLAGNSKSGGSGTVVAAWSATAFDAGGNEISTVGDPSLFSTFSPFAPQPFTLTGPGIASVTFFTQCFNFCGTLLNIADLSAPEIKIVSNCTVNPNDVTLRTLGVSQNLQAIGMLASFTPSNGHSLAQVASDCGFTEFNWVQIIDGWPGPSGLFKGSAPTQPVIIPPGDPINDPPLGGYTYLASQEAPFLNAFPFYYNAGNVPSGCALQLDSGACGTPITDNVGFTLNFFDSPRNACLPGGALLAHLLVCDGPTTSPQFMSFKTQLVGVCAATSATCTSGPGKPSAPLFEWTWNDNFNGGSGGGVFDVQSASFSRADPTSGTGGITITSLNGIGQTPPSVTCTATPTILWPPNNKQVTITVSGSVTAGTSAITAMAFMVRDSEGQVQPSGPVTVGSDGSYSFAVQLVASRDGNDKSGRQYTVGVTAADHIGNAGSCAVVVNVPHDQGN